MHLKFALKVTHHFRKCQFGQISLNSATAVTASEKSSNITNRKSTMRFPSSHRWTLCITPKSPKGWLKTRIFYLALSFISSLQVIVDTSNLVCGWNIASPSLRRQIFPERGVVTVTWPLFLWKMSDNISKMVRNGLIVSTKFE